MHTPQAHQGAERPEQNLNRDIVRVAAQLEPEQRRFERDILEGLARTPKASPSMHLYDARGSQLFQRIMDLPEYYVTRVEREILERHGAQLVAPLLRSERPIDVIDLGAGDGLKSRILLEHFAPRGDALRYLPIDISEHALHSVLECCRQEQPWLATLGVVADYAEGIAWLSSRDPSRQRLVLVLGSNVGNLTHGAALGFFRSLRRALCPGDQVLVGFDLVKDPTLLQRAYDDPAGVTAEFNINLLRRINRELRGDFDLKAFRHFANFAPLRRTMESYLMSTRAQTVHVAGRSFEFQQWEPVRTEISCKYRPSDVSAFARAAGFSEIGRYLDERRYFVDALWSVEPDATSRQ
jgi:L-histidine Nalpha-methyltransferase